MTDIPSGINLNLAHPCTAIVAGPTSSGKSTLMQNIIKYKKELFNTEPKKTFYYYRAYQSFFPEFLQNGLIDEIIEGFPSGEEFKEKTLPYKEMGGTLVIFDDALMETNNDMGAIYTVHSHHCNASVFLLTQNLFSQAKDFRVTSLNCHYAIVMKNPRDVRQIATFASQFMGVHKANMISLFRQATKTPFSYILLDMRQQTPDIMRIRTDIIPKKDKYMKLWIVGNYLNEL